MRQWTTIIFLLLLFAACTTRGKYAYMRNGLDSINRLNREDQVFGVNDVQHYVDYFDRHGTTNDKLLAYYLLGRAYHEGGDAPMALQYYQSAIEQVDTTNADCDYAQLSRVYGQMADVFYGQSLYEEQLRYDSLSMRAAWLAHDTITALLSNEQCFHAYRMQGKYEQAIDVAEHVAELYSRYGYERYAALMLGCVVEILLDSGEVEKASRYMDAYESTSGLFDADGNIEKGREVYYYFKGLRFFKEHHIDSAMYWFRKELRDGLDFNNQNAGALGLAMAYEQLQIPDSVAKYYKYAYAMNDSFNTQMTTKTIKRIQAMYDYSRYQKVAQKKTEEAWQAKERSRQLALLLLALLTACTIAGIMVFQKSRTNRRKYEQSMNELRMARSEWQELSRHEKEFQKLIGQKEKQIRDLEKRISRYGKQIYFTTGTAERCLKASSSYQRIEQMATKGLPLSSYDKETVMSLVAEYFPGFEDFLSANSAYLKKNRLYICILLRLHFMPTNIAEMLCLSKSQVSQVCTDIMQRIFGKDGSSKRLQAKLGEIY